MANHKSGRNGVDNIMQKANTSGLDSFDDWPEPPVAISSANQQRCTSTATISMMAAPRNRPREAILPPISVQYDMSRVGAVLPSNLSPVGMNIASGLGTALSALSINGAPRPQRSSVPAAPSTLANKNLFRSEVSNSSPIPSNGSPVAATATTKAAAVMPTTNDRIASSSIDQPAHDTVVEDSFQTADVEPMTPRMFKDVKATIADRRSSFFNEIAKSPVLPPRSASQYSVPHSQPINLVHERTKRFETRANDPSNTTLPFGCEPILGPQAAGPAHKRRVGLGTYRAVSNDDAGAVTTTERFGSRVDDLSTNASVDESPVFIQSSLLPQFARLEPSPERILGSPPLSSMSSGSTIEYVGSGGSGMSWESDRSVLPMRVVSSSADLESECSSSSARLQGNVDNTRLGGSGELITSPSSAPQLQTWSTDDSREHLFDIKNKSDVFTKSDTHGALGAKVFVTPDATAGAGKTSSGKDGKVKKHKDKSATANKGQPVSHSPHARTKKPANEQKGDATSSPPKQKETWKGKVARTFKRYGSGSVLSPTQPEEVVGALGVPLNACQMSKCFEFVPSIVEMCTRVVEEKGLMNQGIYRVPGNTSLINQLVEELNKLLQEGQLSQENNK